jgi:hypothetical protein
LTWYAQCQRDITTHPEHYIVFHLIPHTDIIHYLPHTLSKLLRQKVHGKEGLGQQKKYEMIVQFIHSLLTFHSFEII